MYNADVLRRSCSLLSAPGGFSLVTHLPPHLPVLRLSYLKNDVFSVQHNIVNHVEYTIGRTRYRFDDFEAYQARRPRAPPAHASSPKTISSFVIPHEPTAPGSPQAASYAVRDRLIECWNDTNQWYRQSDPKRVYYLSMEFLMVRDPSKSGYRFCSRTHPGRKRGGGPFRQQQPAQLVPERPAPRPLRLALPRPVLSWCQSRRFRAQPSDARPLLPCAPPSALAVSVRPVCCPHALLAPHLPPASPSPSGPLAHELPL